MKDMARKLAVVIVALGISQSAMAYVGPGAGLSLLGALWGLLVAVGTALLFIVLWPVRRLRRRLKNKGDGEAKVSEGSSEESSQPGTSERDPVETEQHGK